MSMKLPPLNALRCFEAAARLLSLKQAASELLRYGKRRQPANCPPRGSAEYPAFYSYSPTVTVNGGGEIYLRAVQPAFLQIAAATQRLQVPAGPER